MARTYGHVVEGLDNPENQEKKSVQTLNHQFHATWLDYRIYNAAGATPYLQPTVS